jgi:hypothetical protein
MFFFFYLPFLFFLSELIFFQLCSSVLNSSLFGRGFDGKMGGLPGLEPAQQGVHLLETMVS